MRKTVLIKYRYWKEQKRKEEWCVLSDIKDKCWEEVTKKFGFNMQLYETSAKKHALDMMEKMEVFQV